MKNFTEKEMLKNLQKCPSFDTCSQNLCPLDLDLHLRLGSICDRCRWMREPKAKKIKGRVFMSGGRVMPNGILNFVPESNLRWLNKASQKQWKILKIKNK